MGSHAREPVLHHPIDEGMHTGNGIPDKKIEAVVIEQLAMSVWKQASAFHEEKEGKGKDMVL